MLFTVVDVLESESKSQGKHSRCKADHLGEIDVCSFLISFECYDLG